MTRPRFIRPGKGFRIILNPQVEAYINAECEADPNLRRFWDALFSRLKMTALKEGEEIRDGLWSFVAEGSPKLSVPTLQVTFNHDLESITVLAAMVWQDGDQNDDDPF